MTASAFLDRGGRCRAVIRPIEDHVNIDGITPYMRNIPSEHIINIETSADSVCLV